MLVCPRERLNGPYVNKYEPEHQYMHSRGTTYSTMAVSVPCGPIFLTACFCSRVVCKSRLAMIFVDSAGFLLMLLMLIKGLRSRKRR